DGGGAVRHPRPGPPGAGRPGRAARRRPRAAGGHRRSWSMSRSNGSLAVVEVAAEPESTAKVGVAVVGCGYWGPNLIRNFVTCPAPQVVMLCARDEGRLRQAAAVCPQAEPVADAAAVFADPRVEAVAIATPVATHFPLASAALRAGKHVMVEKPLA